MALNRFVSTGFFDPMRCVDRKTMSSLRWLLIIFTLHLPIPCYDLDGDDDGVPIHGPSDLHAWHILLLGVASPSDIDRGPFDTGSPERDSGPDPYGPCFVDSADDVVAARQCVDRLNCLEPVVAIESSPVDTTVLPSASHCCSLGSGALVPLCHRLSLWMVMQV
jgi:hypothetical protein